MGEPGRASRSRALLWVGCCQEGEPFCDTSLEGQTGGGLGPPTVEAAATGLGRTGRCWSSYWLGWCPYFVFRHDYGGRLVLKVPRGALSDAGVVSNC